MKRSLIVLIAGAMGIGILHSKTRASAKKNIKGAITRMRKLRLGKQEEVACPVGS